MTTRHGRTHDLLTPPLSSRIWITLRELEETEASTVEYLSPRRVVASGTPRLQQLTLEPLLKELVNL